MTTGRGLKNHNFEVFQTQAKQLLHNVIKSGFHRKRPICISLKHTEVKSSFLILKILLLSTFFTENLSKSLYT